MGVQESSYGSCREGVPDNQHRVFSLVGGYNPPLVVRACSGSDLVAVALKDLLPFAGVVVNDSSVRSSVKNLMARISCKVVDSLVDILVKAHHPLEVQSVNSVSLVVGHHFVPVSIVHFYIGVKLARLLTLLVVVVVVVALAVAHLFVAVVVHCFKL